MRGRSLLYVTRSSTGGRIVLVRSAGIAFAEWRPFLGSLVLAGLGGALLAVVLSYYALELVIWILYARAGQAATGTGALLQDLGVQAILLPTYLVLVVLLGSTDLLEWGEIAVASLVSGPLLSRARRERPLWLLAVLTPLAALAMLANVIRLDGASVL